MNILTEAWKIICQKMTPTERAARELSQAELSLLEAQSAVEYAQSVVIYNQNRIKRLKTFLTAANEMPAVPNKGDSNS